MSKGEEEEGLLNQKHQHSYAIVIRSQCSEIIYLNLDHAETLDKEGIKFIDKFRDSLEVKVYYFSDFYLLGMSFQFLLILLCLALSFTSR